MYKDILNPSAMKRKNVTYVKELFNCIALMSVTSFVGLEKCYSYHRQWSFLSSVFAIYITFSISL